MLNWKRRSAEEQGALICAAGFVLAIMFGLLASVFNSPVMGILACLAGIFLIYGFLRVAVLYRKLPEKLGRLTMWAGFALIIFITAEMIADWVAKEFFLTELPQVTPWYAVPCGILFLGGTLILYIKNRKNSKLFQ